MSQTSLERTFVHLHVHSEYSLLDGANRCEDLARRTAEMGMPAVALTDHGVMYGTVEFYDYCKKTGVTPILGCEVYVAPSGHTCRDNKEQYHLILLAENDEGYRNLVRLVSIANVDGLYYKPRIDHDLLAKHSAGLIGASACLGGEIPTMIAEGDAEGALQRAMLYRDILGRDNFFLEIQSNAIPLQKTVNRGLIEMAKQHGFQLIATNDAHYMDRADASWHDVLLCVQTGGKSIDDPTRFRFEGDDYYFRSPEEMWRIFGDEVPESLTNTVAIAERCNVTLETGVYHLPNYEIPEGETLSSHLRRIANEGLVERTRGDISEEYRLRLEYELDVIEKMDFPGYFCIVSDIIRYAKANGIPVGPGRGSAAGSLVAWSLKITDIDPMPYGLIFERFLNLERISMPDIDTDISDKQRDEVIAYIVQKYGADHVSQIVTFGRMKSKQAVKDVGRALGIPYGDVDKIAKLIPDPIKSKITTIPEALEKVPDLKKEYDSNVEVRRMIDIACKIEGLARHCSQHAGGIIITPRPTMEMVPLTKIKDGQIVTQYSMKPVEKLGLVKMDFLGLRNLSILEGALENIRANGHSPLDLEKIPFDDNATYEMLRNGDTLGVFQLESDGMRNLIRRLKPDRFEDLVALVALYRPGPLDSGMADQYVERKHGRERVEYPHPLLEGVLSETYGVILYQEQVMQAAARLSGYTLGEADELRSAMGKKKVDLMKLHREKFVAGAEKNGVNAAKAGDIFDIIEKFAGYGFNKSHSVAYAVIAYQTAYLKAHYGAEYLAAYLTSLIGHKKDVLGAYIGEVRRLGFDVLAPDINKSRSDFTVADGVILFGLSAVAKAGATAVQGILSARDAGGPFTSLPDFVSRVDLRTVNKGVIENLIKAGAFEGIDSNRKKLINAVQSLVDSANRNNECANQTSLFEEEAELPDEPNFEQSVLLELEKESMGIYISGHPYNAYLTDEYKYATCPLHDLAHWRSILDEQPVVLGLLTGFRETFTKRKGEPMGILTLADAETQVDVVCSPQLWLDVKPLLQVGTPYLVTGQLRQDDKISLLLDNLEPLSEVRTKREGAMRITIRADESLPDDFYGSLRAELAKHPGNMPIMLDLQMPDSQALLKVRTMKVAPAPGLADQIQNLSQGRAFVVSYNER